MNTNSDEVTTEETEETDSNASVSSVSSVSSVEMPTDEDFLAALGPCGK
jgi:hypothetical protein